MGFNIGKLFGGGSASKMAKDLASNNPTAPPSKVPKFDMKSPYAFMNQPDQGIKIQRTTLPGMPDGDPMAKRFSRLRERTSQELNAGTDKNMDALTRRFASMGSVGSGAHIKLQQQTMENADKLRADQMQGLDIAEAEESGNRQMERDMAQAQMDLSTNLAQADQDFKSKVFSFEKGSKLHELDLAERQQQIDANTTDFNMQLAKEMAKPPKQGFLGGIFDKIF